MIDVSLPAQPGRMKQLRGLVGEAAGRAGFSEHERDDIVLAVNEAFANVIKHAYHFDPDREVRLVVFRTETALMLELHDDAESVDPSTVKPRSLNDISPGGLGVYFIHQIMDETEFLDCKGKGNILRMVKYIKEKDRRSVCTQ
jgi:anti-sigma regulatory factor (Ser/Thr protein kinase)